MHGKYQVVVIDMHGNAVDKFYAETHPLVGGKLVMADGYVWDVERVDHVLKKDRNGGQPAYTAFSHVLLVVSNGEF